MPTKTWVVGEEVLAADFNAFVQQQVVATFANTAARDTWTTRPTGALCVTTDTHTLWQWTGAAWTSRGTTSGDAAGAGGNYVAGTPLVFTTIPAAPIVRTGLFSYHGYLVNTSAAASCDIAMEINGSQVLKFRMPVNAGTTVALVKPNVIMAANTAYTITIRNIDQTITMFADPTFNLLSWQASPR